MKNLAKATMLIGRYLIWPLTRQAEFQIISTFPLFFYYIKMQFQLSQTLFNNYRDLILLCHLSF